MNHFQIFCYTCFLLLIGKTNLLAQCPDFISIKDQIVSLGEVAPVYEEKDLDAIRRGEYSLGINQNFEGFEGLKPLLEGVEIVLLGEQSHGEGTAYHTKIKLIQYLHEELGFDLLLFESGFYDCKLAWELVKSGEGAEEVYGKAVFPIWAYTKEFDMLASYLDAQLATTKPLMCLGFDSQLSGVGAAETYVSDLQNFIQTWKPAVLQEAAWKELVFVIQPMTTVAGRRNKVSAKKAKASITFVETLIQQLDETVTTGKEEQPAYWRQVLVNLKAAISDYFLKTSLRDEQMANNLKWIKNKYPDKKIICWGATSHFLYNAAEVQMKDPKIQKALGDYYKRVPSMGTYLKQIYGEKLYNIGFTAYEGNYNTLQAIPIPPAEAWSLEAMLKEAEMDNFLLPLKQQAYNNCPSRPLGNAYMTNNIAVQMDAVIFNRVMERPWFNGTLFVKLAPETSLAKRLVRKYPEIYGTAQKLYQAKQVTRVETSP